MPVSSPRLRRRAPLFVAALGVLLGGSSLLPPAPALAATETITTQKDLDRLTQKRRVDGSVIVAVPGLQAVAWPKLEEITGRLELALPELAEVDLSALRVVGADLSIGCRHAPREEWETRGPVQALAPSAPGRPSFADGPPKAGSKAAALPSASPAELSLTALERVGGSLSVCAPALLGVVAPALTEIGADLQLVAGAGMTRLELAALERVRAGVYFVVAGAELAVTLPALRTVHAGLQGGGEGSLCLRLPALESVAALYLSGTRETTAGAAERPSLRLLALELPALERATQGLALRSVDALVSLDLPALTRAAALQIVDAPTISSLLAPLLPELAGDLRLESLPALSSLDLRALTAVGGALGLQRLGLLQIELPVISVTGALLLASLRARAIVFPRLTALGALEAEDLGTVELLSLPMLQEVSQAVRLHASVAVGEPPPAGEDTAPTEPVRRPLPRLAATDGVVRVLDLPRLRVVGAMPSAGLTLSALAFSVVRLPALTRVDGPLLLQDLPVLSTLLLSALSQVAGPMTLERAPRLTVLELPALSRVESVTLLGLTGLKRVSARRLTIPVQQGQGTSVGVLDTGFKE